MSLAQAQEALRVWKRDPIRMVRDLFQAEPDRWQADALNAWADPAKTHIALSACAGPGKTVVEAWCGWNFLLCYSDGLNHPNGYAVAITGDNLKDNLWKEMTKWYERCPALQHAFEITAERIRSRQFPGTWWITARSFPKTADPEALGRTLSGLHADAIAYFIDESGDMPTAVGRSAEQGLGNCKWGKIMQAGNPTSHSGMLYQATVQQAHRWYVIRITGDPDDTDRSPRIDVEWAREQIALYGRTNPWVMAFILGQFPPSSLNALLGDADLHAAMRRPLTLDLYQHAQKRIGCDPARFGDDATVLFPRQGRAAFTPVEMRGATGPEVAARWMQAKAKWGSEMDLVDATGGYGDSIIDQCRLAGVNLIDVNFSSRADNRKYFNKRSEMYFRAAEWVKGGGILPNLPSIIGEATVATYWFEHGQFRVVEKAQMKKQLGGRSPDYWDAFCTTFAIAELPSLHTPEGRAVLAGAGTVQSDWDPWANT